MVLDRTIFGATIPGQSGPGSDSNEGVLHISESSSINRAGHQIVYLHMPNTRWKGLTLWQRCSWCSLHPPPADWAQDTRWKGLTLWQRCSWCSLHPPPADWAQDTRWKGLTSFQQCSWYILHPPPSNWASEHTLKESYLFSAMQLMYSTPSIRRFGPRTHVEGVLPLFNDAVDVFYTIHPPIGKTYWLGNFLLLCVHICILM